jgi:peptidoglycan/LPS O-acetylase OafA/YrhL
MQTRVYFSNLDSLRFLAFLAVFIAHAGILFPISTDWFYRLYRLIISQGAYGVNFFFVLSGFLITYLLLLEKRKNGFVSIKTFYLKRILRIWPLYYIVMLISVFLLPVFIQAIGADYIAGNMRTFPNLGMLIGEHAKTWFLFFAGNFYRGAELGAVPFALGVLWSVCVEEQFYLFWPCIVRKC